MKSKGGNGYNLKRQWEVTGDATSPLYTHVEAKTESERPIPEVWLFASGRWVYWNRSKEKEKCFLLPLSLSDALPPFFIGAFAVYTCQSPYKVLRRRVAISVNRKTSKVRPNTYTSLNHLYLHSTVFCITNL